MSEVPQRSLWDAIQLLAISGAKTPIIQCVLGFGAIIACKLLYASHRDTTRNWDIINKFQQGSTRNPFPSSKSKHHTVFHDSQRLKAALDPNTKSPFYYVIFGERGVGKTTAICQHTFKTSGNLRKTT
jgi:hypothetical protein